MDLSPFTTHQFRRVIHHQHMKNKRFFRTTMRFHELMLYLRGLFPFTCYCSTTGKTRCCTKRRHLRQQLENCSFYAWGFTHNSESTRSQTMYYLFLSFITAPIYHWGDALSMVASSALNTRAYTSAHAKMLCWKRQYTSKLVYSFSMWKAVKFPKSCEEPCQRWAEGKKTLWKTRAFHVTTSTPKEHMPVIPSWILLLFWF